MIRDQDRFVATLLHSISLSIALRRLNIATVNTMENHTAYDGEANALDSIKPLHGVSCEAGAPSDGDYHPLGLSNVQNTIPAW